MAWSAQSNYLNQYRNIVNWAPRNFSEILIEIHTFSFRKMHFKMSSGKWRPFCPGLNVFNTYSVHGVNTGIVRNSMLRDYQTKTMGVEFFSDHRFVVFEMHHSWLWLNHLIPISAAIADAITAIFVANDYMYSIAFCISRPGSDYTCKFLMCK